ncbi:hypothetical protein JNW90_14700 [Micromonospora sp. STR1s_5]|nr:hypothetical protein [Micromonospora sp. STR1s_5]
MDRPAPLSTTTPPPATSEVNASKLSITSPCCLNRFTNAEPRAGWATPPGAGRR